MIGAQSYPLDREKKRTGLCVPDSALDTCGWFNQHGPHISETEFGLIRLSFHCLSCHTIESNSSFSWELTDSCCLGLNPLTR